MVARRWLWRVWPELGLRPGKLEKTTRPPGRHVEEAAGATNGEFTPEVPAGDTDRGVITALKVFIAPRLNETTKGAATLKTRGSGREPGAKPRGDGLFVQTGACIRAQQAAGGRVERQVGQCKLLFGLRLCFPAKLTAAVCRGHWLRRERSPAGSCRGSVPCGRRTGACCWEGHVKAVRGAGGQRSSPVL